MTRSGHERTRELIALAGANDRDLSDGQQAWLRAHLQECAACRDYAEAAAGVVRAVRSQAWAADSALVRATQMRVRSRALELQQQRERVWLVCVSCLFVGLSSAITTPFFWRAFEWIGVWAGVSNSVWQAGFAFFWIVPALVVSTVLLARGTHLTSAHLDDNGEKQ
jgi:predicted anti-sigma-YlaC factor YlaD